MKVEFLWDASGAAAKAANALVQTWPSASIMQHAGWPQIALPSRLQFYRYFICVDDDDQIASAGCVRLTRLFPGRFSASLRRGPCTRSPADIAKVMPALEQALYRLGAISVAVNPHWEDDAARDCEEILARGGYAPVSEDEQTLPTATALINLAAPEDALLRSFSQRRRRDLRSADGNGMEVRPVATLSEAMRLSGIMRDMARTTGLEIDSQHDFTHHFRFLETHPEMGTITAALVNGEVTGGAVTYREAHRSYALLVATSPDMRGARSTLLYWQNILDARRQGSAELDLVGYPDPRRVASGEAAGRQEFKDSFRPRIVTLPPIMKKILRPAEAAAYRELRQLYRRSRWKTRLKAMLHRSG
ncbi:GNAT family N-acetyltransferase [Paracoccus jeotgali]|uniref:GNAT family N-acetyltransferase n=1 Tax=Paracoccus jeotgali TaxID=2065379 RepID=UPI0028A803F8|nr:GNAT family N-acetyltransferase [Paracoccus jeotgali]